jgi:hypothetical protein
LEYKISSLYPKEIPVCYFILNTQHISHSLEDTEYSPTIRNCVLWKILLLRISSILGIKFRKEFMDQISLDHSQLNKEIPFVEMDIEELIPVVKYLHRVFFEEGTALSQMAVSKSSGK